MHFRKRVVLAVLLGALSLAYSCDDGDQTDTSEEVVSELEEDCGCPE